MKNSFLKHFAIIGSGTFISMIIGFLTTPIITRVVDPIHYGKFSIFTMYSSIAMMILYLGLDQSMVRYFYDNTSDSYRQSLLFKCLKYPLVGTGIIVVLILILSISGIFNFNLGFPILLLVCIYTLIQIIYRFSLLLVRLQYKSKLYSALGIIQKVSYVSVALVLIFWGFMDDTFSLALATVISALICLIISMIAEKRIWNISIIDKSACKISQKELLTYAYPYIFSMGITTMFQYIDLMFLNIYCSYEEVGIYSSTITLVHVFSIVQTTFNTLWAPMAIEHYTQDKSDISFYQKGNRIITVIMFFIGYSLILCKDVFAMILGPQYREAAYILPFLIFNPIMYTISETTVNGLVFMKKSKLQVVVSIGACLVNLIGNIILVPKLGPKGAAISTGISYIVFFTLRTILSNKYFYVDFHLKKIYLITFMAIVYALYNTFVHFNVFSIVGYVICVIVLLVIYKETVIFVISYIKKLLLSLLATKRSKKGMDLY